MNEIETLEIMLGFPVPPEYKEWTRLGYTLPKSSRYLWVYEAEWIDPKDILSYELTFDEPIKGLVPFAFNGRGDLWCWNTKSQTGPAQYDVWFCPQQDANADLFAPNFSGWFFRVLLEYATSIEESQDGIEEARAQLQTWAAYLGGLGATAWAAEIRRIADQVPRNTRPKNLRVDLFGFISVEQVKMRVAEQFGELYVDGTARWHLFDEA